MESGAMQRSFGMLWAAAVVIPLLGLAGAGWWSWRSVAAEVVDQMTRTADMFTEQTLRAFEAQEAVLTAIDWNVRGLSWDTIATSQATRDFMTEIDTATPTVQGIGLVAPDGRLAIASLAPPSARGLDVSDRDYVRMPGAKGTGAGTFIGAPVVGRDTGMLRVNLSRRRRDNGRHEDGGVVFTGFRVGYFEDFFQSIAASDRTGFALVRADGLVLAGYPTPVHEGGYRLPAADPVLARAHALMAGSASAGGSDPLSFVNDVSLLGANPTALRQVANYPLFITHTYDMSLARAAWAEQMIGPVGAALAAMALLFGLIARAQQRVAAERAAHARQQAEAEAARQQAVSQATAEARLHHAERAAALGHLLAGVAHDFGLVLRDILAAAGSLRAAAGEQGWLSAGGERLMQAADNGGALTRRLLGFAQRSGPAGQSFRVAESLAGVRELLARGLGRDFDLRLSQEPAALAPVRGSSDEFQAVIINLVTNARDAMPEGGIIVIRAAAHSFTEATAPKGLAAGDYISITTTDTGTGMDAETLARAGEAFFTTKAPGGVGLGLAMSRGFAERRGGRLDIESAPGAGARVTLWLPVAAVQAAAATPLVV